MGEARLQQVHADERREQEPRGMNEPAERERKKDEDAGEPANGRLVAHGSGGLDERFQWKNSDVQPLAGGQLSHLIT